MSYEKPLGKCMLRYLQSGFIYRKNHQRVSIAKKLTFLLRYVLVKMVVMMGQEKYVKNTIQDIQR